MQEILNDSVKLYFWVLLSLNVILAIIGVTFILIRQKFLANSIIAKAKILSVSSKSLASKSYEIEYNDLLGRKLNGRVVCYVSTLKKEDEIEIGYDKENPSKVSPNNKFQIFFIPITILGFAFLSIILLIYLYRGIAKI